MERNEKKKDKTKQINTILKINIETTFFECKIKLRN